MSTNIMDEKTAKGIKCKVCGSTDFDVTHIRPQKNGSIHRYKTCNSCKAKIKTIEVRLGDIRLANSH